MIYSDAIDARDDFLREVSARARLKLWRKYLNQVSGSASYAAKCLRMRREDELTYSIVRGLWMRERNRLVAIKADYAKLRRASFARRHPFTLI